jgi:hypothetical protein
MTRLRLVGYGHLLIFCFVVYLVIQFFEIVIYLTVFITFADG